MAVYDVGVRIIRGSNTGAYLDSAEVNGGVAKSVQDYINGLDSTNETVRWIAASGAEPGFISVVIIHDC